MSSASSTAQFARQALADRLREIRLEAGLTARQLAAAAKWHESKTSRIEHGKTAPTDADLTTWCAVCGLPDAQVSGEDPLDLRDQVKAVESRLAWGLPVSGPSGGGLVGL